MQSLTPAKISVRAISDPEGFSEVADAWNRIVREHGPNPFLLSGLLVRFVEMRANEGWRPLLLLLSVDGAPVGIAPLMTRKRYGLRFTTLLLASYFGPDFVLEDRYREECIEQILAFVFRNLHSSLLELTLPAESLNDAVLKTKCSSMMLHFSVQKSPPTGHRLVRILPSWEQFLSSTGHDFRWNIKRMRRNLSLAGTWRIDYVDLGKEPNQIERIWAVERVSWKQEWRKLRGATDEDLHLILDGSLRMSPSEPNFRCGAWFLELNDQTIAYALVLEYGGTAYLTKTSFAEEFWKLSPGAFVVNESIHALCDSGRVSEMDFLTDLAAWKRWPGTTAAKIGVAICRLRVYALVARLLRAGTYGYRILLDASVTLRPSERPSKAE